MSSFRVHAPAEAGEQVRAIVVEALVAAGWRVTEDDHGFRVSAPAPAPATLLAAMTRQAAPAGAWTRSGPVCVPGEIGQVLGHLDDGATVWLVLALGGDVTFATTDALTPVNVEAGECPAPLLDLVDAQRKAWIMGVAAAETRR